MAKLCPRGKAAAKRKFKVYPSAYANAYASRICAGKIKDPSGVKRKDFRGSKAEGGLMEATAKLKRQGLRKGGGADTGKLGELKSKLGVIQNQIKRKTERLKKLKSARESIGRAKKMGGGMMKRASYMGGGLTEATQRLRRQGLKSGSVARGCGAIMSDRRKKTKMV